MWKCRLLLKDCKFFPNDKINLGTMYYYPNLDIPLSMPRLFLRLTSTNITMQLWTLWLAKSPKTFTIEAHPCTILTFVLLISMHNDVCRMDIGKYGDIIIISLKWGNYVLYRALPKHWEILLPTGPLNRHFFCKHYSRTLKTRKYACMYTLCVCVINIFYINSHVLSHEL